MGNSNTSVDAHPLNSAAERRLGHIAMLTFSCLVAGSFSLGSMTMQTQSITPLAFNCMRFAVATLALGAAAMATGGITRGALQAPWRYGILGGLFATYFVMMFLGLKTTTPVSSAAIFTLTPIFAAGFGYLLMRQITTPRIAFALAVGAAGALWVIFRGNLQALLAFDVGRGEWLYFFGVICHAIYTPLVPKLKRGERTPVFIFLVLLASTLIICVVGFKDAIATSWSTLPAIVWITIAYTAIVATAITGSMLIFASVRLASAKVMAYTYLVPTWVLVWEVALGHEVPTIWVCGGIALTIVALYLLLKHEEQT